jgi:glucose-6-phosphate isomerase
MSPERRPSFLAEHVDRLAGTHLRDLLKDAARGKRLRHRLGPVLLDLSRQKLDLTALDALGAHVEVF